LVLSQELQGLVVPHGSNLCRLMLSTMRTTPDPEWIGNPPVYEHAAVAVDCGKGVAELPSEDSGGCWGRSTIELLFVSSSHVSLRQMDQSSCYGRPNQYNWLVVVPIDEMIGRWCVEPPSLLSLESLGPAKEALRVAAIQACNSSDQDTRTYLELPDCTQASPQQWGIKRSRGEWEIVGRMSGWRSNYLDYSLRANLPSGVRAWTRNALSVAAVTAQAPDAQDFLTSPGDAFAVILRPDTIQAGSVRNGRLVLGDVLTRKDPQEGIISAEWATGRHVPMWDALVGQLPASEAPRRRTRS
jgi:hypothetical protein